MSSSLNFGDSGSDVYTGVWVNWSSGMLAGATLTLSNSWGLVLVSFLTIFVGATGGHLWGIITFVLHQLRASNNTIKDGLFHQEQTVLRNSQSAVSSLWEFLKMGWAWRGRANYSMWRMVPISLVAAIQLLVFAIAGIFSSEIFSTSQEVLVRSPSCGFMVFPNSKSTGSYNATEYEMLDATSIEMRTAAAWSLTYSRSCYGQDANDCVYFAVPQIESTFGTTSCPFDSDMCLDPENGAYWADTGLINSNSQLGINSKPEFSIDYRRVTTCAPLKTEGFKSLYDNRYISYMYGDTSYTYGDYDYTFNYDTWVANSTYTPYAPLDYHVSYARGTDQTWTPIPQLNRSDADVTLIFVSSNVLYYGKIDPVDLWYNGREKTEDIYEFRKGLAAYKSPEPVIVMGCTEQHQLCSGNGTSCSPLTGWDITGQDEQFKNESLAIARSVFDAVSYSMLGSMFLSLGENALLASLWVNSGIGKSSSPLPSGFWKQEIQSWQNFSMAYIQKMVSTIATGPSNPNYRKFVVPPLASDRKFFDVCKEIKIRDGRYYSFKIIGLAVTLIFGCLIILTNCFLATIVGWIQRRTRRGLDRREDWELDHLLQLHRMAFDGAKLGTWARNEGSVPVTIKALGMQKFGKPGRGVGAYESVDTADWAGYPLSTFSTATGGFTDYVGGQPIDEASLLGPHDKKDPTAHTREFV